MNDLQEKKMYFILISILVAIILFSNLGQNFKTDNFSTSYTLSNYNTLYGIFNKSKNYQEYIDNSSRFIEKNLKSQGLKPLQKTYIENYQINLPVKQHNSTLEVISKYGKIIKKYEYIHDYFEDYRGNISSGIYIDIPTTINIHEIDNQKYKSSIALLDSYNHKTPFEIIEIDKKLKNIGVSAVISPSNTNNLVENSNIYNGTYYIDKDGLTKLIVSRKVFDELKYFASKGYEIKVKSGAEIKESQLKNIYGVIEGKNKLYTPLVIAVFYDGEYKLDEKTKTQSIKSFLPSSILIETIRAIQFQKLMVPDRTIIFAFLSGYNQNKYGLKILQDNIENSNIIILEDIGISNNSTIYYSKNQSDITSAVEYYLKKNQINILSKNIDFNNLNKYTNIITLYTEEKINTQSMLSWGKFALDIIGNVCYNLDFLTGSFYKLRIFKNFIKEHSAILSLATLIFLIYTIFKRKKPLT